MTVNYFEFLWRYNVTIQDYDLGSGYYGVSKKTKDGYVILLNKDMSDKKRMETIIHEFLHIMLGHHDARKELSIEQKESEVDFYMNRAVLDTIDPAAQ